ncbi:MAG: GNAT family N-acetyltransferase [Lachnospiraceae bacterium]|nr:GNAT family N-acetyltransferase [Lachnospiraceae bacterium]
MDNFADERDFKILEEDKHTFFVLRRIIAGECKLLLTDHERLIICHTNNPFPVWIWTPDDVLKEEKERAYALVKENGLLTEGHTFNMKYNLADYFIVRASEDAKTLSLSTNMFAYDCPNPIEPDTRADGELHRCVAEDIDEVVEFMDLFHKETGIDQESLEAYRHKGEGAIRYGSLFLWENAEGRNVSSCNFRPNGDMASVGLVYTRKEYRRKHYAENLVYQVTKIAKDAGFVPMLYTDADYVASNACYEKIGYILRGKLCTLG